MRARAALLLSALVGSAAAAQDAPPMSAIDWLSRSIAEPPETGPAGEAPGGAPMGEITVTPLDAPRGDAAGLLPPDVTGLPRALWGPTTAEAAAARIAALPRDLSPALGRLVATVLLAEAEAPPSEGSGDALLLARVDRLLVTGALDRAGALIERAGIDSPERFRRYFDIALLQGSETEACGVMRANPDFSPTYPARIFCLARSGDWTAAAVTLETATSLGILTAEEDLLLARFLDPDIAGEIAPPDGNTTPLNFRLREAIGEPMPTATLPLAFAWADLRPNRGWKAQIAAAERLARAGALSANQLFGLYLRQRPSASGGLWDRAEAVQRLDRALAAGDTEAVAATLPPAWASLRAANLHHALAAQYGAEIAALGLDGQAGRIALTLGLLSDAYEDVALDADGSAAATRFVVALARGVPETAVATDDASLAVRQGFAAEGPPPSLAPYLAEGRVGEAILKAVTLFAEGASGDIDGLVDAIATLRALGLEGPARRAALELLLSDGLG